jgi:hypothetical protein
MKKIIFLFAASVALSSCTITKRHYAPGYQVQWKSIKEFGPSGHRQNRAVFPSQGQTEKDLEASSSSATQAELVSSQHRFEELNFAIPSITKIERDCEIDDDASAIETFGEIRTEVGKVEQMPRLTRIEMAADTIEDHVPDQIDLSANKKLNQKALWGMILSLVGLPTFYLSGIGVLLCCLALDEIKKQGGRGKRLAQIGVFVPVALLGLVVLYLIGFMILYAVDLGIS